ncbi:MAG TPA: hypothetical protein VF773_10775 [Verrucomicrobiae bacterium]
MSAEIGLPINWARTSEESPLERIDVAMDSFQTVQYIEVYSSDVMPSSVIGNWNMAAIFAPTAGTTVLACRQNALQPTNFYDTLLNRLLECFETTYGYQYERLQSKGPTLFAFGLVAGLGFSSGEMIEADAIARWGRGGIDDRRYLHGVLRDVFPLNLLSRAHLAMAIENRTLETWIRHSKDRGTLLQLVNDRYIWKVGSQQISHVQLELTRAGLLISHDPSV